MTKKFKNKIIEDLIKVLSSEQEVEKVILFGSFIHTDNPNDLDIAIFQSSDDNYLNLALKYRKLTRTISKKIPIDIIPIRADANANSFVSEIESGVTIYER